MVSDHDIARVESVNLVSQHECTFRVRIIRNDEPGRFSLVIVVFEVVSHHKLQNLGGFTAGCSTHIEH
jgi:hypothetical protein